MTAAVIIFCAALLFVLYVLFGYPILLLWLARNPKPIQRRPFRPPVTVIIAVYNGEQFIEQKLRSVLELDYPKDQLTIVVASDGSTDRTDSITATFARYGVKLLSLPRGGKPCALNAAISEAGTDILVFTDVRQTLAPDSLKLLMENFADPTVGAVSAELVIRSGSTSEERNVGLYWKYEFFIRTKLSAIDSIFGATGAYYAMRRELAVRIPEPILLDDMYLPLAAFFKGYRLVVDPRARMFDYPTSLTTEFRRKVRTLAGNYQILRAYPQLLTGANRMLLHFLSYKLARLELPFALVAIILSSCWLPYPWNILLLFLQAAFYSAAVLDRWVPAGMQIKKCTSPIRTFVTMMVAALFAASILFRSSESLWRPTEVRRN